MLLLSDDTLSLTEYLPVNGTGKIAKREKQWIDNDSSGESDEDFKWVETLDEKGEMEDTYFTFINETREVMKAGTQAWNCYGNRSNVFLMVNYGFCFRNNLYDSFHLHVRLDLEFSKK